MKKDIALKEGSLSNVNKAQLADYNVDGLKGVDLDVLSDKEVFANDIVIPKIWLIQTMSELSKARKANDGDYVNSRTEEVILKVDDEREALPVIVLKTFKRWQTFELLSTGKKKFISSELMVLGKNHDLKYEDTLEGKEIRRRQVISAYVLLGSDAQAGINKPYVVDFAATSKGAGRDMVSDIKVLNEQQLPSWLAWFKLSKVEESNDEGSFYVKKMKFGGMLPPQMQEFLKGAYDDIKLKIESNAIEIDDRDVHDAAKGANNKTETKVNPKQMNASI